MRNTFSKYLRRDIFTNDTKRVLLLGFQSLMVANKGDRKAETKLEFSKESGFLEWNMVNLLEEIKEIAWGEVD